MHEIMTIEEVAKYLRVSERTIYDWAQKGVLPGGKIGTTWRFKTTDIQKWVNDRLENNKENLKNDVNKASQPIIPERVIVTSSKNKVDVLNELIDNISTSYHVVNKEALKEGILEREKIMSTGIGLGIAIPHVRSDAVNDLILSFAICKKGIKDYGSLDQKAVQIVCMLAARSDQHKEYLRMLSVISSKLKEASLREQLLNTNDKNIICELLTK